MKKAVYLFMALSFTLMAEAQQPDCNSTDFYLMGSGGPDWGNVILKFNLDSPAGPVSYYGSTASDVWIGPEGPFIANMEIPDGGSLGGLAIADFGDGNRFYASHFDFMSEEYGIAKYNGAEWEAFVPDAFCIQLGGNGEHLYLQSHQLDGYVEKDRIDHFDGNQLVTLWESQDATDRLMSADIAIDDNGNAYFFTGPEGGGLTDTLHIMTPNGEMIAEMPVEINFSSSAGAFFMYDTLYLYNSLSPVLLPVHISASGAIAGNPIPVPDLYLATGPNGNTYFHGIDAATCASADIQLSVREFTDQKNTAIYPNPVKGNLFFESKEIMENVEIYNTAGQKVFTQMVNAATAVIDVHFLMPGTYLVKVISKNQKTEIFKIIKS